MIFSKYLAAFILSSSVWVSYAHINSLTVMQNPSTGQLIYCLGDCHKDDGEINDNAKCILNFLNRYKETSGQPMNFLAEMHPEYSGPNSLFKYLTDLLIIRQEKNAGDDKCMLWTLPLAAQRADLVSLEPLDSRIDYVFNYSLLHDGMLELITSDEFKQKMNVLDTIFSQRDYKQSYFLTVADIETLFKKACNTDLLAEIVNASLKNLFHYYSGIEADAIEIAKHFTPHFTHLILKNISNKQILCLFDMLEIDNPSGKFNCPFMAKKADGKIYCATIVSIMACYMGIQLDSIKNEIFVRKDFYGQCAQTNEDYTFIENIFDKILGSIEGIVGTKKLMNYMTSNQIHSTVWNKEFVDALILHRVLSKPDEHNPYMLYFGGAHIAGIVNVLRNIGWTTLYKAGCPEAFEELPLQKLVEGLDFEQLSHTMHEYSHETVADTPAHQTFDTNDSLYQICEYPEFRVTMYHGYRAHMANLINNYTR